MYKIKELSKYIKKGIQNYNVNNKLKNIHINKIQFPKITINYIKRG